LHQVLPPDQIYRPHQRFGMYRWHARDPICFSEDLRVTIQALGWKSGGRYLPLEHADIATTAFWYQTEPHAPGERLATDRMATTPLRLPAVPRAGLGARLRSLLGRARA
jgi:Protein of unknown function (DUF2961)